jgi:sporulation protein YqfC
MNNKNFLVLKSRVSSILELPKEVVLNLPLITMIGTQEVTIQNYKGITEYSEKCIRVNTNSGTFKVEGESMVLKLITEELITVVGKINKTEFLN